MLAVLSPQPVEPEPDLARAWMAVVQRDRELAAPERRRKLSLAAMPPDLAARLGARAGRRRTVRRGARHRDRRRDHEGGECERTEARGLGVGLWHGGVAPSVGPLAAGRGADQ